MANKKRNTTSPPGATRRQASQSPPPPRPRRPKRSKLKTALYIFAALFIGSAVFEFIACFTGEKFFTVTRVGSAVGALFGATRSQLLKPDKGDEQPEDDDGFLDRIGMGIRNLRRHLRRETMCLLVCAAAVYLLACTALAASHTAGRILHACGDAIELISYDDAETPSSSADVSTDPPLTAPTVEPDLESTPDPTPSVYVALTEPGRVLSLPDERYNELYYLTGEYAVESWEDDETIAAAVSAHVAALVAEGREDHLASSADPLIEAEIDQASAEERVMQTSAELDLVIARREEVFADCPFAEMADLIAENYNGYGLAYYTIHGNAKTVEYYWGASIHWLQNCLTFSSASDDIASILNRIGTRYHDLAQNQPYGSEEQIRASKLSDAYVSLARSYSAAD